MRATGKAEIYDSGSDDITEVDAEGLEWDLIGVTRGELGTENHYRAQVSINGVLSHCLKDGRVKARADSFRRAGR